MPLLRQALGLTLTLTLALALALTLPLTRIVTYLPYPTPCP